MTFWVVVVYALATARLTGLVTADALTEPLRDRLILRLGRGLPPPPNAEAEAVAFAAAIITGRSRPTTPPPDPDAVLAQLRAARPVRWAVGKLATCAWCASIWIGAGVAAAAWWHGTNPWAAVPALALAYSQVTGMFSDTGRG